MWSTLGHALKPVLGGVAKIAPKHGPEPIVLPQGSAPIPATSLADLDTKLQQLHDNKDCWVNTPAKQRAQLLEQCAHRLASKAKRFAELSVQAKGSYGQGLGEELICAWPVILGLKEYEMALKAGGQPRPKAVYRLPGVPDQLVAEVFPWGMNAALLPGTVGQVYMAPGKPATQGQLYRDKASGKQSPGGVSLVLGAGNQFPVVMLDILHKLIAEDEVVCAKMSPVNEYLGPEIAEAFQPLIEYGVLHIVYGGVEVGQHLVSHQLVDSVHLTGSADTFNAIVWGGKDAPRTGTPKLTKRVTAELGNVTPYVMVPGDWSAADITRQVKGLVEGLCHNAGHNCNAAQVVVTAADWPLRERFLAELRKQLSTTPQRAAYYPGSKAKYDYFKTNAKGGQVSELGVEPSSNTSAGAPVLPWLLVDSLSPDQVLGKTENWCGVLQEVCLPGVGAAGQPVSDFLTAATQFVHDSTWGSLAISVSCHPDTQKQDLEGWNRFVAGLRYGCVTINCPAFMGFAITALPWGAAPGNTPANVESGIGFVHNTFLFDHAVKSVLQAPWVPVPKGFWYPDNYALPKMAPHLLRMTANLDNPALGLLFITLLASHAVRG